MDNKVRVSTVFLCQHIVMPAAADCALMCRSEREKDREGDRKKERHDYKMSRQYSSQLGPQGLCYGL